MDIVYLCVCVSVCARDLSVPHRVGGVGDDGGSSLLAVVCEGREAAAFSRLDAHLQIRVRIEEHAFL